MIKVEDPEVSHTLGGAEEGISKEREGDQETRGLIDRFITGE